MSEYSQVTGILVTHEDHVNFVGAEGHILTLRGTQ